MKKLMTMRKRGFTLIETVLVLAVGLGLIVGGIIFFQQAQASSDLTDKTRTAVGISSEVRAQARTLPSFNALAGPGEDAAGAVTTVAAGANAKTDLIRAASSLQPASFNGVEISAADQEFTLTFTDLNDKVCIRMSQSDLGPNSVSDPADCATGTLAVTYSR